MGLIIHYIRTVTEIMAMVYLAVQHNLLLSSGMQWLCTMRWTRDAHRLLDRIPQLATVTSTLANYW
jgi:hypothetical protein